MPSGQAKAVRFWVVTRKIGNIKILVKANAGTAADALERVLIVEVNGKGKWGRGARLARLGALCWGCSSPFS